MSGCYCDFEPADVYVTQRIVARKPHKCDECRGAIGPGEKYERAFMVYDHSPSVYETCARCLAVLDFIRAAVPCFCHLHTNLHNDAVDCAKEYQHEAPGLLFGVYRRAIMAGVRPLGNGG